LSLQQLHRPKTFKDFIGNESAIESIKNVLKKDPPSAFLFIGKPGSGKTSMGRVLATELGCSESEFEEKDAADDRSIDSIRRMKIGLKNYPLSGKKKVVLLDEMHSYPKVTQNALLKILEEPPSFAHIILCTTNPEALLDTIKRRCHIYELETLTSTNLHKLLKQILKKEKIKKYPVKVRNKIVELSEGSAGSALKYLDMVIDFTNSKKAIQTLKSAGTAQSDVIDICKVLWDDSMSDKNKWYKMKKTLRDFSGDAEQARRAILGILPKTLLKRDLDNGINLAGIIENFEKNFYDSGMGGLRLACYKSCFSIVGE
jgi:DNA polymerase-3 subunit gamma/tau